MSGVGRVGAGVGNAAPASGVRRWHRECGDGIAKGRDRQRRLAFSARAGFTTNPLGVGHHPGTLAGGNGSMGRTPWQGLHGKGSMGRAVLMGGKPSQETCKTDRICRFTTDKWIFMSEFA